MIMQRFLLAFHHGFARESLAGASCIPCAFTKSARAKINAALI
jgi:hypothetical protein